jgi:hypothetical protein
LESTLAEKAEELSSVGERNEENYRSQMKKMGSSLAANATLIEQIKCLERASQLLIDEKSALQIAFNTKEFNLQTLQIKAQTSEDKINELDYLRGNLQSSFELVCNDSTRYTYI